jgi:hypothetical protein
LVKSPEINDMKTTDQNRRNFLTNAAALATALPLLSFETGEHERTPAQKMFIHHVYFWLNNPNSREDFEKLVEGLRKLSKVETIRSFHIGKPASTSRDVIDGSYSISWFTTFEDLEAQESYQKDPIHLAFVASCKDLWSRVLVYDSVDL